MAGTTNRWFESAKRADGDRWVQVAEDTAKKAIGGH